MSYRPSPHRHLGLKGRPEPPCGVWRPPGEQPLPPGPICFHDCNEESTSNKILYLLLACIHEVTLCKTSNIPRYKNEGSGPRLV
ncbi:hypothetical protein E2C01_017950 [Portunus trituberculatus]|uniref:Uncharacterized protein n=1 Tax=Portunus trituberculatus TaxID=210409 RepID=A0A5B7DV75_PORTR|nr:hypothetical protein [Portunus trituberculatus]